MEFRRTPPLDFRVEISPLIDVVFLLLIFFMVSTTFVDEAALDIQLPESGSTVERPREPLKVIVTKEGIVEMEGKEVSPDEVGEAVREALRRDGDRAVVVEADGRVVQATMVKVYDALSRAGATGFILDTLPESSAPAKNAP